MDMIKKVGSFFKKSNNDWLNLTVSIVFSIIMIIFFSKTVASSYALPTELPDTIPCKALATTAVFAVPPVYLPVRAKARSLKN